MKVQMVAERSCIENSGTDRRPYKLSTISLALSIDSLRLTF